MKKVFVIGREPAQNYLQGGAMPIVIIQSTETQHISRSHCRLSISEDGSMILEDLNSKSGTFVDGYRLTQAQYINESSKIELGKGFPFSLDHPMIKETLYQQNNQLTTTNFKSPSDFQAKIAYADFGQRFIANIVDNFFFGLILSSILGFAFLAQSLALFIVPLVAILIGLFEIVLILLVIHFYFILPTHRLGASFGRRMFNLYYLDLNSGRNLSIGQAWGRYLSKFLSGLLFGFGYLMPLWTEKRQALHDQLANTVVVQKY